MSGKTDMDRIGLFSEVGYVSVGDKYPLVDPSFKPFNEAAYKKAQMLSCSTKKRYVLNFE